MYLMDLSPELTVDWVLRELPASALRGAGRTETAARVLLEPKVTLDRLRVGTGLRSHADRLRAVVIDLDWVTANLLPAPTGPRNLRQVEMLADYGTEVVDLVQEIARRLLRAGHAGGFWSLRVLQDCYRLNGIRQGGVVTAVRSSYNSFFDTAVLRGLGRLTDTPEAPGNGGYLRCLMAG